MPRGYQFPDATSIDHPVRPVVRQGAAKLLPLIDHPGGGAAIGEAVGLAGVVPHLVDVPGNLSIGPGQGPRDNIASVQTAEELDYAQFRRDERTRIANCSGTIGNGNCTSYAGGVFYDTPDGDWWNTPYAYIGNPSSYNGGTMQVGNSANSTWSLNGGQIVGSFSFSEDRDDIAAWNANWNNCNCGSNNCYTNCNCNCACSDCTSCP
jgi:hypothetical protein